MKRRKVVKPRKPDTSHFRGYTSPHHFSKLDTSAPLSSSIIRARQFPETNLLKRRKVVKPREPDTSDCRGYTSSHHFSKLDIVLLRSRRSLLSFEFSASLSVGVLVLLRPRRSLLSLALQIGVLGLLRSRRSLLSLELSVSDPVGVLLLL